MSKIIPFSGIIAVSSKSFVPGSILLLEKTPGSTINSTATPLITSDIISFFPILMGFSEK